MSRKLAGTEIERLIQLLARLPGLGPRSARKAALALIKKREELLLPLAAAMSEAAARIAICPECGNVDTQSPCTLCRDDRRDRSLIVVVEEVGDLWALERADAVNGRYHVLGGRLSPLDGVARRIWASAGWSSARGLTVSKRFCWLSTQPSRGNRRHTI